MRKLFAILFLTAPCFAGPVPTPAPGTGNILYRNPVTAQNQPATGVTVHDPNGPIVVNGSTVLTTGNLTVKANNPWRFNNTATGSELEGIGGTWDTPTTLTLRGTMRVDLNDYASPPHTHGNAVEIVNPLYYTRSTSGGAGRTTLQNSVALQIIDAKTSNPVYVFNAGSPLGALLYICSLDGATTGSYGPQLIDLPRDVNDACYVVLDSAHWVTMTDGVKSNTGVVAARYIASDLDVHAFNRGYFQNGCVIGQGAQFLAGIPAGAGVFSTYGVGGENSAPLDGYGVAYIATYKDGVHIENLISSIKGPVLSDAVCSHGSLLTSGSVESTGPMVENTKRVLVPSRLTSSNAGIMVTPTDSAGTAVIAPVYGSSANTITQGNDSRLSDARTPVGTALTSGNVWIGNGSNLAAALGLSGDVTMTSAGVTAIGSNKVTEAMLNVSDVTTKNASTSAHGFLKKLDNNASHFMDGTGVWSTPTATEVDTWDSVMGRGNSTSSEAVIVTPLDSTDAFDFTAGDSSTADNSSHGAQVTIGAGGPGANSINTDPGQNGSAGGVWSITLKPGGDGGFNGNGDPPGGDGGDGGDGAKIDIHLHAGGANGLASEAGGTDGLYGDTASVNLYLPGDATIAKVGGVMARKSTTTGNGTTAETEAFSAIVPAHTLSSDGNSVALECGGELIGGATKAKRVRVYYGASGGGTVVYDSTAVGLSTGTSWRLAGYVMRAGQSSQQGSFGFFTGTASTFNYTSSDPAAVNNDTDEYIRVTVQSTGIGAANNDVTLESAKVRYEP